MVSLTHFDPLLTESRNESGVSAVDISRGVRAHPQLIALTLSCSLCETVSMFDPSLCRRHHSLTRCHHDNGSEIQAYLWNGVSNTTCNQSIHFIRSLALPHVRRVSPFRLVSCEAFTWRDNGDLWLLQGELSFFGFSHFVRIACVSFKSYIASYP